MIAATEAKISVLEFDRVDSGGLNDGTVTLAADAESSAAENIDVSDGATFGSGAFAGTLRGGTIRGTLLAVTLLGVTSPSVTSAGVASPRRTSPGGTTLGAGGAGSCGAGVDGVGTGAILLAGTVPGTTALVSTGEGCGALGRGT